MNKIIDKDNNDYIIEFRKSLPIYQHKEEIIEMKVNRPFIFIITSKDRQVMNGGFLFLAKI